ncbi:MAG TPA: PIN domain-containing protein [Candidatus Binatia bacterium]
MVLVDTSVWIRFLAGREPFVGTLDRLLSGEQVMGHELIQGELLIGDPGSTRARLLADYCTMHRAATASHADVVDLVRSRKLQGRGIGWIDAHLLASALLERCSVWTADAKLADVAAALRITYAPTR